MKENENPSRIFSDFLQILRYLLIKGLLKKNIKVFE